MSSYSPHRQAWDVNVIIADEEIPRSDKGMMLVAGESDSARHLLRSPRP